MTTAPEPSSVQPIGAPLREIRLGQGVVVARGDVVVVIDDCDLARASEIWRAIGDDGSVDAIIDELARDGLRSIPTVVIAAAEGAQLRVIVRGAVSAEVVVGRTQVDPVAPDASPGTREEAHQARQEDGAAAEVDTIVLDGAGVKSWSEQTISDWSSCTLQIRTVDTVNLGAEAAEPGSVYLSAGVIFGSEVVWYRLRDVTELGSVYPATVDDDGAIGSAAVVDVPPDVVPRVVLEETASPASQPADVDVSPDRSDDADQSETGGAPAVQAAPPIDHRQDGDDPYADMFGRTVHRDVQTAAVDAAEASTGVEAMPDPSPSDTNEMDSGSTRSFAEFEQSPTGPEQGSPATSAPPSSGDGDHDGHTMTVEELQRLRADADQPGGPLASPPQGDHDGHTISLAALRQMRGEEPSPPVPDAPSGVTPVGPTVQAVICPHGHPNPSYASSCRLCGQQLTGPIVVVARPPLGSLRASTGEVVELDRPVIVGRNPSLSGRRLSEIPREWKVASADGLSRNHAMFHIDGWQVRVEDLGSVNSTTVTLPGREPEMLRAGEPVLITDGAIVDLGGEVTCRYEATV